MTKLSRKLQTQKRHKRSRRFLIGNEAAKIRSIRPPEPYKGKGIKYHDERILRKAGKSGKK